MIDRYMSRAELWRFVTALLVVIGAITIAALFGFLVVPGLRNQNKPPAAAAVKAVQGEPGWLDPTAYPATPAVEIPPVDPETVLTPTPGLLERGKSLYAANCSACHGDTGLGDGPGGKGLVPPPRNLAKPEGWKNGPALPAIWRTLAEGIRGSSMASYDFLPKKDRIALAHFVQSLGAFPHGDTPAALDALGREFASGPEKIPARIPVSLAMTRLVEEAVKTQAIATGTPLLSRVVADPGRAGRVLAGAPEWKKGPEALAFSIALSAPANGFSTEVTGLTPAEWKELHAELLGMFPDPTGGGKKK